MATSHGSGRGGQRNRQKDSPDVKLSKAMSYILRHGAEKMGLTLQPGGFLYVEEILQQKNCRQFSVDDVKRVTENNEKKRFHLEEHEGRLRIRANQGHTMEVAGLELTPILNAEDFPLVVHGTYFKAWDSIKTQGLSRMKRNHIHFAPGEPGEDGVISGMRGSCDVLVFIDLAQALKDGLQFFLSANMVILSSGDENGFIHPRYFTSVIQRRTRKELLQT